jgi:hypothetical protein
MTTGYVPSRDAMLAISRAMKELPKTFVEYESDRCLPCYPVELGADEALLAIFDLERALNPERLAWPDSRRRSPEAQAWPRATI